MALIGLLFCSMSAPSPSILLLVDVVQPPKRVAQVEALDAPWLDGGAVFKSAAGGDRAPVHRVKIVNLDRDVRYRRSGSAFCRHADLRGGWGIAREGHDPAKVHDR